MEKKKNINTTNLAEAYGNMTLAQFEKAMPTLGFEGDFKKAHADVSARMKASQDKANKIAERNAKLRADKIAKRKKR